MSLLNITKVSDTAEQCWGVVLLDDNGATLLRSEKGVRKGSLLKCVWVAAAPVLCLHSRGTASRSTRRASGSHRRDARSPAACC